MIRSCRGTLEGREGVAPSQVYVRQGVGRGWYMAGPEVRLWQVIVARPWDPRAWTLVVPGGGRMGVAWLRGCLSMSNFLVEGAEVGLAPAGWLAPWTGRCSRLEVEVLMIMGLDHVHDHDQEGVAQGLGLGSLA